MLALLARLIMNGTYLLLDARGPEIQHRSGLTAPDAFIYLAQDGSEPVVFFDAREYQVMKTKLKKLKNGVQIEQLEPYLEKITGKEDKSIIAAATLIMMERGIEEVRVSGLLPYASGQQLEAAGFKVAIHNFAGERERKTESEIRHLMQAQRVNESAFELAWRILSDSQVEGDAIMYQKEILTSEIIKKILRGICLRKVLYARMALLWLQVSKRLNRIMRVADRCCLTHP